MTPGCTRESCEFRDFTGEYAKLNTEIIGISPDDLTSHSQFINEYSLPFLLLSDTDHKVCEQFGVWKLRERNGEQFYGVERSTFLINEQGVLVKEWRAVQVDGHVADVLASIKQL
jgi:peroxiredoxin Q/BCP